MAYPWLQSAINIVSRARPKNTGGSNFGGTTTPVWTLISNYIEYGSQVIKLTLAADTNPAWWLSGSNGEAKYTDDGAGGIWYGAVDLAGPTPNGWQFVLVVQYTDATEDASPAYITASLDSQSFTRVVFQGVSANLAKTVRQVYLSIRNPSALAGTVVLRNLDIRHNQPIDADFIVGDRGEHYYFTGTVDASPSVREAYAAVTPAPTVNAQIPAGRNLIHNPRPTSLTNITFVGATGILSQERSYSGDSAIRLTAAGTGNLLSRWTAAANDDADLVAITGGTIYSAQRVAGPVGAGWRMRTRITYSDNTTTDGVTAALGALPEEFTTIIGTPVTIDSTKTLRNITLAMELTNATGIGTIWLGGAEARLNQQIDSFIHGDIPGGEYSWEGTANASPSRRGAYEIPLVLGGGGQFVPSIRLEVVNIRGEVQRDISEHFLDGDINYDLEAEQNKGSCTLVLDEPGLVLPLSAEFVRVSLRIERPDGTIEDDSLGMFTLDLPRETWLSESNDQWTYEGRDLLDFLATFYIRGTVLDPPDNDPDQEPIIRPAKIIKEGDNFYTALKELLTSTNSNLGAGLSVSQISFPDNASWPTATHDISWAGGTDVLTMVTDILEAAGQLKPWVTPHGVITSAKAGVNPSAVTPAVTFATGNNSRLSWPFEVTPDGSKIGNRVRVVSAHNQTSTEKIKKNKKHHKKKKKKDGQGTIEITKRYAMSKVLTNNDPQHPLSFARLGRYIDIPDITMANAVDQAAVDAKANQALINAGNIPIRVKLVTEAHIRGLNEVYLLDLRTGDGEPIASGQGRYWCRGWSMQLGAPWEMAHTLVRVIPFATAAFLG